MGWRWNWFPNPKEAPMRFSIALFLTATLVFIGSLSAAGLDTRVAEAAKDEAKALPSLHSDQYYPIPKPSIRTGVKAMSLAVMNLMQKP